MKPNSLTIFLGFCLACFTVLAACGSDDDVRQEESPVGSVIFTSYCDSTGVRVYVNQHNGFLDVVVDATCP